MIVMSRHKGEKLIFGGTITLEVVEIKGDKVRLRIESPSPISILKLETFQEQKRNNAPLPPGKSAETISRRRDETIVIGDDITVTIIDIRGDKVRLGAEAPRDVSVHRQEVYEAIHRESPPQDPQS